MKTALLKVLLFLAGVAVGAWALDAYKQTPIRVRCEGPEAPTVLPEAGAISSDGSCDLSWSICWKSA